MPQPASEGLRLINHAAAADWLERGWRHEQSRRFTLAVAAYHRAVLCDPTLAQAHFNLANALIELNRLDEALACLRLAVRLEPGWAEAWYNLADVHDEQGDRESAIACLQRAVRLDPAYADACFNLARLLDESGRAAEAAAYWRRYLQLDPHSDWAFEARAALRNSPSCYHPAERA